MIKPTSAVVLLLALLATAPASAWDWVQHAPAETTAPALRWMGQAPDGTLWGADYYAVYKLSADGGQSTSARVLGDLAITTGGDVIAHSGAGETSTITRLGLDLRPRWTRSPAGRIQQPKDDGTIWLSSDGLLTRLNSVGAGTSQASEENLPWPRTRRAGFADRNPSVLLTLPQDSFDQRPFRLIQRNATAALDWRFDGEIYSRPSISRDDTRTDSDILLFELRDPEYVRQNRIVRLDAMGKVRSRFDYPQINAPITRVIWHKDGGFHVLFRRAVASWQVARIESDGRLAWTRELTGYTDNFDDWLILLPDANGDLIALWPQVPGTALRRLALASGDGATLQLPFFVTAATLTGDGRVLASILESATGPTRLAELRSDGSSTDISQAWPRRDANSRTLATEVQADGTSFVLSAADESPSQPSYSLSRIAPDGSLTWVARGQGLLVYNNALSADATHVCIGGSIQQGNQFRQRVQCHAAGDGSLAWSRELETASTERTTFVFRQLEDGRIIALYDLDPAGNSVGTNRPLVLTVLDRSGTIRLQRSYDGHPVPRTVAIDEHGSTTFVRQSQLSEYLDLLRLDSNGNVLLTRTTAQLGVKAFRLKLREDGGAVLQGATAEPGPYQVRTALMTQTGDISWRRETSSECGNGFQINASSMLSYCIKSNDDGSTDTSVLSIDLASGNTRWTHTLPARPSQCRNEMAHSESLTPDGKALVIANSCGDRVYLYTVDAASGERIAQNILACATEQCVPQSLDVAGDSVARVTMLSTGTAFGQRSGIYAKRVSATPPAHTRLDQPGISGAWYSPYALGEGIALDWFPAQRTIFGAWYTYTTTGGTDPAQLRWYTVQAGDIPENATSVELPILETRGGNFDAGPPAAPARVGSATLRFSDCNNGTLHYTFDAGHNDAASGSISLSRLSPGTASCVLADGSTVAAAGARPPQGGFDARMSGTWFEEATSGQGLQFTVQPGGTFFTAWFTYDPQGQANDPNHEHWFTLQGNLATAQNGRVEVLIAQSLGGAFDRVPTYNGFAVGKATVTMTACDKATVDYRFDDNALAGDFRNKSGTLELSKIGGCR